MAEGFDFATAAAAAIGAFLATFTAEWIASMARGGQAWEGHRNADLEDICEATDALRKLGEEYWTKSAADLGGREAVLSAHIVATQHHVALLYSALFTGDSKRDCDVAYTRMLDAVSGGDFGSPQRAASPDRLQRIHLTALTFRHTVRMERRKIKRKLLA